ncbi:MAG: copper amine oxidase N-terminal domain-containing protein [Caldisericia bacterium]|nr:copper amine oxidase N-terminal domain-containing protein [Caldisericia bacterium]
MKKIFLISLILLISLLFLIKSDVRSLSEKKVIKLQIGNKLAYVDGSQLPLDVPPQILNGRTMVPVRFISEGLGAEVGWDGATKTVTITMDSIEYLKNQINNFKDELNKKETSLKEKDDKIEELQIKVNNLENTKVRVTKVVTFKNLVDNKWSDFTDTFKSSDDNVYTGISINLLEDAKFNLQINLYDPYGTLLYTGKWDNQDYKKGSTWNYWYRVPIKNFLVGGIPGVWKAKVLIDGKESGFVKFNIVKDETYKVTKAEIFEAVTCKSASEGNPQNITQKFSKQDERAIVFIRFKGKIESGFRIKFSFYQPDGKFYTDAKVDIKSIKPDEESWAWGSIKIKGFTPENLPGEWKCKIFFDDDLVKELSFIIE